MFDDWCGLDFGKYAFPLMILGSLALHVWDVTSDVLVAIVLYNQDIVYFGVSTGIMVLGSLFSSFASVYTRGVCGVKWMIMKLMTNQAVRRAG